MSKLWFLLSKCPALIVLILTTTSISGIQSYSNYVDKAKEAREQLQALPTPDSYTDDSWSKTRKNKERLKLKYEIKDGDYCIWADSLLDIWTANEATLGVVPNSIKDKATNSLSLTRDELELSGIKLQSNQSNREAGLTTNLFNLFQLVTDKGSVVCDGYPWYTLTLTDVSLVTREPFEDVDTTWRITYNGEVTLERNAINEYQYRYFVSDPGDYTVCLISFIDGAYREISNTVSYTIPEA